MDLPASLLALLNAPPEVAPPPPMYPESDGQPMADNSRRLHWVVLLYSNLRWLFRGRQDVAVHANLLWYTEEGDPTQRQAPDVMVVFGRPPGERGSYLQWQEGNVPVTVVFEIISPSNTDEEMQGKEEFYDHHRVEEYFKYNPQTNRLTVFRRQGDVWVRVRRFENWVSPRLGVRFVLAEEGLRVETPDGQPFVPFEEMAQSWMDAKQRGDEEMKRVDSEKQRADVAEQRARRLVELGRKVRQGQATPQELAELDELEK
jgi:Uma2 family endonuclease